MKYALLASSMLSCLTVNAIPADAVVEEVVVVPESFNWTSGYLGLAAGYGWGDSFVDFEGMDYTVDLGPEGFIGGVFGGYNYQFTNNVVIGAEADIMYSDMDVSGVLGVFNGSPDPAARYGADIDWTASVRGRLGYAFDRFLPYVTAGVAFAHYDHFETQLAPASESGTRPAGRWRRRRLRTHRQSVPEGRVPLLRLRERRLRSPGMDRSLDRSRGRRRPDRHRLQVLAEHTYRRSSCHVDGEIRLAVPDEYWLTKPNYVECLRWVGSTHRTFEVQRPLLLFPNHKRTYCSRPYADIPHCILCDNEPLRPRRGQFQFARRSNAIIPAAGFTGAFRRPSWQVSRRGSLIQQERRIPSNNRASISFTKEPAANATCARSRLTCGVLIGHSEQADDWCL